MFLLRSELWSLVARKYNQFGTFGKVRLDFQDFRLFSAETPLGYALYYTWHASEIPGVIVL